MIRPLIRLIIIALLVWPAILFSAEQRARLDLLVNQQRTGVIDVVFRGDDVMTRVTDLTAAGIEYHGGRVETINGIPHVSLKSLARILGFEVRESHLSLALTTKPPVPISIASSAPAGAKSNETSAASSPRPKTGEADLLARLAFHLDDARKGEITVIRRGNDVLARLLDVEALEAVTSPGRQEKIRGEIYISLNSLASQFAYVLDERDLTLRIISKPKDTAPAVVLANPRPAPPSVHAEPLARTDALKSTDQRAIFGIKVNEIKKSETDVVLRDDDVLVRLKDLQEIGMVSLNGRHEIIRGDDYVSLRSLVPTLSYRIDENELTLDLTVTPEGFGDYVVAGRGSRPEKLEYREDTTGFLNYSVNASNFKSLDTFVETGLTIKNALLYSGVSRNTDGSIVRGFSNVTINNRENTNRIVVGDRLVNSDFLGGSVTMGGLSYFRDFALDPYFLRNPGLNYSGAVSTPSTLDVYSNGRLIRRLPLPPGQFQLKDLPVPTGSNNTRFVIRDAFGRERELGSQFFYFTSGLLRPGLHDFSYNLGSLREDIGVKNWGYGLPVLMAQHRYGFTDFLTAGLRLEGGKGLLSGGPSFSFLLPIGEMEFASAASAERSAGGGAGFLGYNYVNGQYSFGTSVKVQSDHYATTSLSSKKPRSWLESGAYVAFPVSDRVGVNFRYGFEDSREDGAQHRVRLRGSAWLSKLMNFYIDGNFDLQGRKRSAGFSTGLSVSLGEITGSMNFQNEDGQSSAIVEMRKSLPIGPGYGYGLQASTRGDLDSIVQYQTSFGRYEANFSRLDGHQQSYMRAAGGLAFIDGNFRFTRPVQDGFALIKVPGLTGIRGYLNNLDVGTTDSQGRLFVPNLLSYYGNRLSISRGQLPLNYNADVTDKIVAAPHRGGVVVEFPVARIQRIVGKAVIDQRANTIVPKHGQLTVSVQGKTVESPLGNNGEFYFENLTSGSHPAKIEFADDLCELALDVPKTADEIIQLGTVRCQMQ